MHSTADVPALAEGKWRGILSALGVDARWLAKKNGPCIFCGGKDRYRFTDYAGRGMFVCSNCGTGDGFELLMRLKGWDFKTAIKEVGGIVGTVASPLPPRDFDSKRACRAVWVQSVPVVMGSVSGKYLHRRLGITSFPDCIRHVERLRYDDPNGASWHPGMIALVRDDGGNPVTLHRTYLAPDGTKAGVPAPKKTMRGRLPRGSSIRLGKIADGVLGIAEGIETALAAGRRFGVPVWSVISADGMAQWLCPAEVTRLVICGDCDVSFTGQAAAYACARANRTKRPDGLEITVEIPDVQGSDWADEHISPTQGASNG